MKTLRGILAVVGMCAFAVLGNPAVSSAVNECCITGAGCLSSSGFPYDETDCPGDSLCGCVVSGTNCQFELNSNVTSSSSSDCLTIGAGVTFDMNDHSITCTGSDCGAAIKGTGSSSGSGQTKVTNGFISGCWDVGISGISGGGFFSVDGMHVELGRSCTNGLFVLGTANRSIGMYTVAAGITNSQVHNTEFGVLTHNDVSSVALTGNAVGLISAGGNTVTDALFSDNDVHIQEANSGGSQSTITVSDSSFVDAVNCNRANSSGVCQSNLEGGGVALTGSDPIIVCSPSDDASRICTIR